MNDDLPYIPGYRRPRDSRVVLFSMFTSAVVSAATAIAVLRWGPPVMRRWAGTELGAAQLQVQVPRVTSMQVTEAGNVLEAQGLRLLVAARKDSPQPPNMVLEQQPLFGAQMPSGGTVAVVVSTGQSSVAVPDLSGHPLKDAKAALEILGLSLGSVTDVAGPTEQVVAQNPTAGSRVPGGTPVALSVGMSKKVAIPRLRGVSVQEAKDQLNALGLEVGSIRERYDRHFRAYVVLDQTPDADTEVEQGSKVSLVINEGD